LRQIDINTWNRKLLFKHFKDFADPYFSLTIPLDVTIAYQNAKKHNYSFFARYLHDCMKAVNKIENFRYRIIDDKIIDFGKIHTSPTLMRPDKTFGFSFVRYDENFDVFVKNLNEEQERINNSSELYPAEEYRVDCIHCSAMPWLNFSGHKEPVSGQKDSIPKLAFGKAEQNEDKMIMKVAINANHALVDGYHVSLFAEEFQNNLNHKQ